MLINIFSIIILSISITCSGIAQQPGDLDPAFGDAGKKFIPLGAANSFGRSVVVQSDDKLTIACISNNSTDTDFSVVRLTSNGELDESFSEDGHAVTDFGSDTDIAQSIAIDALNRIVVAGYTFNGNGFDFGVVRYLPDGQLDESFGDLGKKNIQIGNTAFAKSITIQSDQKILVSGFAINPLSGRNEFSVVRIHENGTMDSTFHEDGIVMTDFASGSAVANAMALQPDGKILLAGQVFNESTFLWEIGIARYSHDGSLDPTWDEDGLVHTTTPGVNHTVNTIAIDSEGKIIVGGYSGTAPSNNLFTIARYHADGSTDNSFAEEGMLIESFGFQDNQITSIVLQPDGKILAGGYTLTGNANRFAIARLDHDGSFDQGFGQNGVTLPEMGQNDGIETMALQSDGKLVVAGERFDGNKFSVAAARFETGIMTNVDPIKYTSPVTVYPNPAVSGMKIFIELPEDKVDHISLFDVRGHVMKNLSNNNIPDTGVSTHSIQLPSDISPGVYFLKFIIEGKNLSQPIIIQ